MNMLKNFFFVLMVGAFLVPGFLPARTLPPFKRATQSIEIGDQEKMTMLTVSAGFLAGGKQNTCYLLRTRLKVLGRYGMDASLCRHFYGDMLYNANISYGNNVQFTAGVEFGDRTYFINKDSSFEHIHFKNISTGEYEPYSSFTGFTMPEEIVSYNIGLSFGGHFKQTNFWRGVGESWSFFYCKFEMMYAPSVGYSKTYDITTQGPYQAQTTTYELEGIKDRKFGFRMMLDMRLGSKLGWVMEVGMRPGIRYEINDENRFSNGYLRMGVVFAISVGGRKGLHKPGFGKEIPEN